MAKPMMQIVFDEKALQRVRNQLSAVPRQISVIMPRAINRTAGPARTQIASRLRGELKLKSSVIKKGITWIKATRNWWRSDLFVSRRRIPLINFGAKQTAAGVAYTISKTSGRKIISSAFIATMASGHTGVFRRKTKSRKPIMELYGLSLGQAFSGAAGIASEVVSSANKNLARNIDMQVKHILSKYKVA